MPTMQTKVPSKYKIWNKIYLKKLVGWVRYGKNKYLPFSQKNISYRCNQKDKIHEKYPTKCSIYIFNRWSNIAYLKKIVGWVRHGKNKYLPFSEKNISYRNNQKDTIMAQ